MRCEHSWLHVYTFLENEHQQLATLHMYMTAYLEFKLVYIQFLMLF